MIFSEKSFEGSLTEEGTGLGKDILVEGLNFAAYEARKKSNRTSSAYQGEIREKLGSDQGVIGDRAIQKSLDIYEK